MKCLVDKYINNGSKGHYYTGVICFHYTPVNQHKGSLPRSWRLLPRNSMHRQCDGRCPQPLQVLEADGGTTQIGTALTPQDGMVMAWSSGGCRVLSLREGDRSSRTGSQPRRGSCWWCLRDHLAWAPSERTPRWIRGRRHWWNPTSDAVDSLNLNIRSGRRRWGHWWQ
jgi:hypothetical protein